MIKKEYSDKGYIKEYFYVTLLGIIFCFLVSVITYNPTDSTTFNVNSTALNGSYQVTNTLGSFGAKFADWSFQIFGVASILFLFIFFIQVLSFFRKEKLKNRFVLRVFGYPQLIVCYLGLLAGIVPTVYFRGIDIPSGGFLGKFLFESTRIFLGDQGAVLLFSLGAISSLTLCLGIRPISTIFWLFSLLSFRKSRKFQDVVQGDEALYESKLMKEFQVVKDYEPNVEPILAKEDLSVAEADLKSS